MGSVFSSQLIKVKLTPRFPARVTVDAGIGLDIAGGVFTFHLDYSSLTAAGSPSDLANTWMAIWDLVLDTYRRVTIEDISAAAAGAPSNAPFVTTAANATLSAEAVLTDSTTVAIDLATPGAAKFNVISAALGIPTSVQAALDLKQPLDADLTALAALSTTGVVARTAANTYVPRAITGTAPITVTNGDGVAGAPAISLAATGYRFLRTTKIVASGTYTKPSDATAILVEAVAGGGAGGGGDSDGTNGGCGGGGAAGGYARAWIAAPASSYSVTIGAAGAAAAVPANGGDGGATAFGAVFSCPGGGGGWTPTAAVVALAHGGFPGSVPTGTFDIGYSGDPGESGIKLAAATRSAGNGARSPFGAGGKGWCSTVPGTGGAGTAVPGAGYGSGGSGAMATTTADQAGGAGAPGLILVHEYGL